MKIWRKWFTLYIYSGIHIGLCVSLLTAYTYAFFQIDYEIDYLIFTGLATWCIYGIHSLKGYRKVRDSHLAFKFKPLSDFARPIVILTTIAFTGTCIAFFTLSKEIMIGLLIPFAISIGYVLEIPVIGKKLKELPYVKIFLIVIVYVWVTAVIPLGTSPFYLGDDQMIFIFVIALYVFAMALPFDIRDRDFDYESGVMTLVHVLGKEKVKTLSLRILFFLIGFVLFMAFVGQWNYQECFSLLAVFIITLYTVFTLTENANDLYFSFCLDGTLALFFIVYQSYTVFSPPG